ncbi:MAG: ATP cone domain-containing protein [Opitutaceae bacterium]
MSESLSSNRVVIKRDGATTPFDVQRIVRSIALALFAARQGDIENVSRNDASRGYGLGEDDFSKAKSIGQSVEWASELFFQKGVTPTADEIQDLTEKLLAAEGEFGAAKAYILYRAKKNEARLNHYPTTGMQDYIFVSRYARYNEKARRRETWDEAVDRVENMHLRRFGDMDDGSLEHLIREAFTAVRRREVLPSMRALQFAGPAIEAHEARIFNCSFTHINRLRAFPETLYLLLCGCGVGFSVQKIHVDQLPPLAARGLDDELDIVHHTIEDTIEGWSNALEALLRAYVEGHAIEFNYSQLRSRGQPLRTSGGKAPGHFPLKRALTAVEAILRGASGRRLEPIEAYDIVMHMASAVLAGGVRRSATIALFSADDEKMMQAKTGDWFRTNPQRSASNNSAVLLRGRTSRELFTKLFESQKEFGEPGFFFSDNEEYGANPCVEIGLHPVFQVVSRAEIESLKSLGVDHDDSGRPLRIGSRLHGFQMCNLTTINGALIKTPEDFHRAARNAAIVGTLQAAYTDIPYLGPVTRLINEREALLGVSICGIMDNPKVLLDPEVLQKGANVVRSANEELAAKLGIAPAARTTCVKPEGTTSLLLGTGSGIHFRHARRYFRRIQANRLDPVYRFFKEHNPHLCEPSAYGKTDDVITFPVEAPPTAVERDNIGAVRFLEMVRLVQENWVIPGTSHALYSPGLYHNVSNTVTVKNDEWDQVVDFIWENRSRFTGIALLQAMGDKAYVQAPMEAVTTSADIQRWNQLEPQIVPWASMHEATDETKVKETVACAGGQCELNV